MLLTRILSSGGWPSIPVSLTKQVFVVLLQLLLLPLQPPRPASSQQQQEQHLSLPIRWSISLRAAEALSAFAAAAAIGNCRSLLLSLQQQQQQQQEQEQDVEGDTGPNALGLQRALQEGLVAAAAAARGEGKLRPGGDGGCGIESLPLMAAAAERMVYILLPRMLLARAPSGVISALLRAASMLLLLPVHLSSPLMLRHWNDEQSGLVRQDPVLLLLQLLLLHICSEISGIRAADLLQEDEHSSSRMAAAAAAASAHDQRNALQKQQQKLLKQGGLETAAAAAAAAAAGGGGGGASAAGEEGETETHQGDAAYRHRLLERDGVSAPLQEEETLSSSKETGNDDDFGDGVRLEGPRAAAFFMHAAASLSHLSEVLAEGQQHWRTVQHPAELQQLLLLLLLHASRRSLSPKDPLGDALADEALERLVEP